MVELNGTSNRKGTKTKGPRTFSSPVRLETPITPLLHQKNRFEERTLTNSPFNTSRYGSKYECQWSYYG